MMYFEAAPSEATACAGSKASYPPTLPAASQKDPLKQNGRCVVVCGGRL